MIIHQRFSVSFPEEKYHDLLAGFKKKIRILNSEKNTGWIRIPNLWIRIYTKNNRILRPIACFYHFLWHTFRDKFL